MRKKMWFGTIHHSQWINTPLTGADMTPQGWGTEGTYLSGGGFVRQSQDSHRTYMFEWGNASAREDAEIMQAYRDGVYSKKASDLMYFVDPLMYTRNVLPRRWAQPSILLRDGVTSEPSPLGTVSPPVSPPPPEIVNDLGYPMRGVRVSSPIQSTASANLITEPGVGSVWIPIPEGKRLVTWTRADNPGISNSHGIRYRYLSHQGTWSTSSLIDRSGETPSFVNAKGVLLIATGDFDFYGARAILTEPNFSDAPADVLNWVPGMGHSGCSFVGNPTWVANSGVNGGQIGYAATLKEVGDWHL